MPAPAAAQDASGDQAQFILDLLDGYEIEKVVDGLNFPTALAWDDDGRMYVLEAGGALYPAVKEPIRILQIEEGNTSEVVDLTGQGVFTAAVGLVWHDGAFYLTHRDADDLTGAVSRVTLDGEVTRVFDGLIDSQAEHQINDIRVGPDGRMYVTVGAAGNSGVVDTSIAPWVMLSPELHPVPCQDITLTGRNFQMPNPMTKDDPDDMTMTGAYVPFGTETQPGQVIEGDNKCGGSILAFDPANAEQTITPVAWGFRNLLGIAWDPATGDMYAAQNGYDIRGARPVQDEGDPLYRVRDGAWYGVPDFSAALQPLTEERFNAPDEFMAEVFINSESVGQDLGFVIDHEASGLTPPDPGLLVALHPFNSSPSMIDVVPPAWGDLAGHVLVAEWGDLAPPTNPLRGKEPVGSRVVSVDPETGEITPFVANMQPGPASGQDAQGQGLDRPFDVQFGPDGALYIVDYGVVEIDMSLTEQGRPPYNEVPGTGVIWRVTGTADAGTADAATERLMTPMIVAEGVTIDGDTVTVPQVVAERDGFLVIHTVLDGQPVVPESIGHAAVSAGVNENVEITINFPFADGEDYLAMLHLDSNGNGTYDFGPEMTDVDTPVMVDGQAVVSSFSGP
ncbi:PQQ-dependent sugar dehydrogenase [Loktanella sp. DJP18]|uniref:PQQ-dependent sugar dehydrogenase n=1 Tax=Loktanella sp. DJP18 TaxID=3409788 RepID=UPI003BB623C0